MANGRDKTQQRQQTFAQSMRALAKSTAPRRTRDINPARCVTQIEWAARGIRDELQYGGQYILDSKTGRPVVDEHGKRVFVHSPSLNKIRGYAIYADVYFKLLRKVQPDAAPATPDANDSSTAAVLAALVEHLPD